jgi:hypothetical protein
MGDAGPTLQLSMLDHDLTDCCGRRSGDLGCAIGDLDGSEIRTLARKEMEGKRGRLVGAEELEP